MADPIRNPKKELEDDPLWHKDAVIYQVHVRAFNDSNRDGIGDFRGLTEKLEYVRDLGATAIWLLPFYPSPLKDDGYDISDYHNAQTPRRARKGRRGQPPFGADAADSSVLISSQRIHSRGARRIPGRPPAPPLLPYP